VCIYIVFSNNHHNELLLINVIFLLFKNIFSPWYFFIIIKMIYVNWINFHQTRSLIIFKKCSRTGLGPRERLFPLSPLVVYNSQSSVTPSFSRSSGSTGGDGTCISHFNVQVSRGVSTRMSEYCR